MSAATPPGLGMPASGRYATTLLFLCALLIATAGAYWSGLSGPFVFDDYNNIVDNPKLRIESASFSAFWEATFAGDAGPLKRPLSMLSFAANHLVSGLAPFPYKLTNLAIHLLNGCLLFLLCQRLLDVLPGGGERDRRTRNGIALATMGVWLLHPVQLTSVLYVVQRMTSLSASFVLLGLLVFIAARRTFPLARGVALLWLGVPACGLLAALAKENGLLLFFYAYVVEVYAFRYAAPAKMRWGTPRQFFALTVALPLVAVAVYLLSHPAWFDYAAANRPFTVLERLWSQSRALFLYLHLLFVPAISNMALFYDDFAISRGWFQPVTTALSCAALAGAVLVAIAARRRWPWFGFALGWFLAGHAMESTIVNLELIHPHRNYVAFVGPMLALCVGGSRLLANAPRRLAWGATGLLLATLTVVTALRAQQWRNPLDLAAYEVIHRPESARANYEIARLLNLVAVKTGKEELRADAIRYLRRAADLAPTEISSLLGIAIAARGEIPDDVLAEIQRRLRARPMGLNQVSYLQSLLDCQRGGQCKTPPAQMQAIFTALLGQRGLRPRVKADALTMLGIYYIEQLGDIPAGVNLMQEAAALQPEDPARFLNLARAQLVAEQPAAATESLARAADLDPLGAHRGRITDMRRDIEEALRLPAGAMRVEPAATVSESQAVSQQSQPQLQETSSLVEAAP